MFRNHLKSIIRSLKKNRGYTLINISGLAIGFAAAILIAIYVNQEFTYDKHYKNHEQIYRLSARNFAYSSIAHLNLLKEKVAGVEATVMVQPISSSTLKYQNSSFVEEAVYYSTKDYLKVFDQKFVYGNPETAFDAPNALLLSASMSKKIFGNQNPIGEIIEVNSQSASNTHQVTGVIEDLPLNTHLRFQVLAKMPQAFEDDNKSTFNMTIGFSYFKMETTIDDRIIQDQSDEAFARRSYEFGEKDVDFETFLAANKQNQMLVMNLADVHLNSNLSFEASAAGNLQYLYIFLAIAVFIIILASINYVNLATAQASKRAKEVGVRKVLGSFKRDLVIRFLTESFLITFGAAVIGLGLAEGALNLMFSMGFSNFNVDVYDYPSLVLVVLVIAAVTGMLAGIYPALFLTSFKPSTVLKGDYRMGNRSKAFRSTLVVFQFVVSLSLAIFSVFVYQQLNYGLSKDLGFTKEGVLVIENNKSQIDEDTEAFKNELLQLPAVQNISSNRFSMIGSLALAGLLEIGGEETFHRVQYKLVDAEFAPTMGMTFVDGRNFDDAIDEDRETIIVNETFAKILGTELYEKNFNAGFLGEKMNIVGVVKDFHAADFSQAIAPTVFFKANRNNQFNIRVQLTEAGKTLNQIKSTYAQFTDEPLEYYFFDQKFNQLFASEKRMSQIITVFTGLSLFVALLGLIGLISYKLDQRIKEIGIRKVLGASITQILSIFSKEMARLIAIAMLITIPVGFYATSKWLDGFAYHIDIAPVPFLTVAVLGLSITLLIVCLRTVKTASMNPISALRDQ